ncbi:hypothetical protein GDO81_006264 [Engystomops pustulosus]|uniref:Uncharacterized protein n=1 Tax=Engystomops pustulosus TaxID=76066 RepID=A0AAV7CWP2_ENGPU|nr:hypothetical protein GDO81_006264 [Engystomops pustulosus]
MQYILYNINPASNSQRSSLLDETAIYYAINDKLLLERGVHFPDVLCCYLCVLSITYLNRILILIKNWILLDVCICSQCRCIICFFSL